MFEFTPEKIEYLKKIKFKCGWEMKDEEYEVFKEVIEFLENLTNQPEPQIDLEEKDGEIKVVGSNLYNKRTLVYNAIVEIWENTVTGECSTGWIRTPDTYEEVDPDNKFGVDLGYLN